MAAGRISNVQVSITWRRQSIGSKAHPRLAVVAAVLTVGVCLSWAAAAEPSTYQKWQQSRPFTIGAMYYDAPYGKSARIPAPPAPIPTWPCSDTPD